MCGDSEVEDAMAKKAIEKNPAPAGPKYKPLNSYENLDRFRDRLRSHQSSKSPSLLALQALTHSRPDLAKKIFETAVMEPFTRLLTNLFPGPSKLSDEAARRVEDMQSRFVQEPIYAMGMLEAIFVIERIEPWAEDTVKLMSRGELSLEKVRESSPPWASKVEQNGCALAMMDLGTYVRERDYRIMLELISAIDGRTPEMQAKRILADLPILKGMWDEFGDGTTESIIGPDGAQKIVSWILGYVEF
jgi:hypothetical protein